MRKVYHDLSRMANTRFILKRKRGGRRTTRVISAVAPRLARGGRARGSVWLPRLSVVDIGEVLHGSDAWQRVALLVECDEKVRIVTFRDDLSSLSLSDHLPERADRAAIVVERDFWPVHCVDPLPQRQECFRDGTCHIAYLLAENQNSSRGRERSSTKRLRLPCWIFHPTGILPTARSRAGFALYQLDGRGFDRLSQ